MTEAEAKKLNRGDRITIAGSFRSLTRGGEVFAEVQEAFSPSCLVLLFRLSDVAEAAREKKT